MIRIAMAEGCVATLDDEDAHLAAFKWRPLWNGRQWYASRRVGEDTVLLHRLVARAPTGSQVDHINGDSLDCRRANLRLATAAQNQANRGRQKNNTSGFKGVSKATHGGWRAVIKIAGRAQHIGSYATREEAARAYDRRARAEFGSFAWLNFPTEAA